MRADVKRFLAEHVSPERQAANDAFLGDPEEVAHDLDEALDTAITEAGKRFDPGGWMPEDHEHIPAAQVERADAAPDHDETWRP